MAENIQEIPAIVQHRHGKKSDLPQLFEGEGGYTDDTLEWLMNIGGKIVNMNGSLWHMGTAITGTSSTTNAYSFSACPLVKVGDCYLNTAYGYVYQCTTAGEGTAAKWTYKGSVRGATGATGATGAKGDTGSTGAKGDTGTRGSQWYSGTALTGTATDTNYSYSGASNALVGDYYLNTSTGSVYRCVISGSGTTAKWQYQGSIKGATGATGATGTVSANITKNPDATDGDIIDTHLTVGTRNTTVEIGKNSFAQGYSNKVSALEGFASGRFHNVTGNYGFAANYTNTVTGSSGFACGNQCSSGRVGMAGGTMNHALDYQTKFGRFASDGNAGDDSGTTGDAFTIGIGTITTRKNGFRVDYSGKCYAYNTMSSTGADYAEVWEWLDGNPNNEDRVGRFVAFEGTKIRLATANDPKEILGIISAMPAIAGDNFADEWHGMYLKDKFGRLLTEHKLYEAEYEEVIITDPETGEETTETRLVHPAYEADEFIINPDYDPEQEYIPRLERPEFDAVGTHGKLVVIDDGTCTVGGFCMSSENGIATASETGFYVMERIDETTIRVYVK